MHTTILCYCTLLYLCKQRHLHPCWIAAKGLFHKLSNSAGLLQYLENWLNIVFFSSISGILGNPGSSLLLSGVHLCKTFSPKNTSNASFHERVGALLSMFRLLYLSITLSKGFNVDVSISGFDKVLLPVAGIGRGE